jgi:hypothetical protein
VEREGRRKEKESFYRTEKYVSAIWDPMKLHENETIEIMIYHGFMYILNSRLERGIE